MKNSKLLTAVGFAVTTAFAGTALAQQRAPEAGFYAGISVGQSEARDSCDGAGDLGLSCDEKDTAWKLFGGYQFNRNLAAEIGYTDRLTKVSFGAPGFSGDVKASAWELVGIGAFPIIDRFSVYGKAGLYRAETKASASAPAFGFTASAKETNTDLTYGVGVKYDFTRNVGLRAEWQRYNDVGGGDIGEDDVDVLSVGVVWKF